MSDLYRFGQFVLDPGRRTLSRADSPVSLTPKAFDVLLFLAQNPNRLVTKEELLQAVWGDTFVEEGNLKQYISHLRRALGDNSEEPRLIVTITRKGYQFTAPVTVVAEAADIAKHATLQATAAETPKTDAQPLEFPTEEKIIKSPLPRLRLRKWLAAAALLAVIAAAFGLRWSYRRPVTLSATDTIVLADVKNATSDPVFDDALDTALRYEMEQTPYLNILGVDKVFGMLAQLNLPPTAKLTPEVARQICGKTNSKMVISQSIGDAGNGYHLEMRALDCASGAILAKEQADTGERNEVVHELGVTAARLRAKLGEPADSLARFNQPLEKALSASLEALQAHTQGHKLHLAGEAEGALKLYQRAVELDPSLAVTHEAIGAAQGALGHHALMVAAFARAYELRQRMTEKNRLNIELIYYSNVTGELDKAYSISLRALELYPHVGKNHLRRLFGAPAHRGAEQKEARRTRRRVVALGIGCSHADKVDTLDAAALAGSALQVADRADFDGADASGRHFCGDLDGIVQVGGVNQVEASQDFLCFGERTVRNRNFSIADAHAGGRANGLKGF